MRGSVKMIRREKGEGKANVGGGTGAIQNNVIVFVVLCLHFVLKAEWTAESKNYTTWLVRPTITEGDEKPVNEER